ncbi:hypothetical protein N9D77_09820, partial [Paracoccaceae bacterium]|nr:hypothetical protein [Paracoccaceae bacterium]
MLIILPATLLLQSLHNYKGNRIVGIELKRQMNDQLKKQFIPFPQRKRRFDIECRNYLAPYTAYYEAVFITTHQNVPFTFVDSDAHVRAHVPNKSAANKYEITLSNAVCPSFVWLYVWL